MSDARPPQGAPSPHGLPQTNPHSTAAPRPAGAAGAPRPPIQPPPAQRLPGQPGYAPAGGAGGAAQPGRVPPPLPNAPRPVIPVARPAAGADDGELINLEDDDEAVPLAPAPAGASAQGTSAAPVGQIALPSKIKITGAGDKHSYTRFKRNAHVDGTRACRVRTFHGRLSDEGLAFMDDKINEWLDNHPEVDVKHVTTNIGPMEGKHNEQAMFVTIWY